MEIQLAGIIKQYPAKKLEFRRNGTRPDHSTLIHKILRPYRGKTMA
jgi:hypothetical protein